MGEITVFISYSHDSDEHREQVLALSERLRADGIKTLLDQYVNGSPRQGWPRWMLDQLDAADFVLVVCTETYYRRFRGHEEPGKGKGVDWEGALITQGLYDSRSRTLKFVPIFLSAAAEDWIPEPLRSGTHYTLTSGNDYKRLYDFLRGRAGVEPGPVGVLKTGSRPKETAPNFGDFPGSPVLAQVSAPTAAPSSLGGPEARSPAKPPRVYISYTWRTEGLKRRALKLAERLHKAGIDTRIDLFYAKSLHGFTPPDPLPDRDSWEAWQEEQIRDADCVLVICTPQYVESPISTGAWRDMNFMRQDLESGRAGHRKFIPVGFGTHKANAPFIPAFIKGATYYDLIMSASSGFGFEDVLRRLKTEFGQEISGARRHVEAAAPLAKHSIELASSMKNTERSIVWLHLSDLHNCKEKTGWDAHRVLRPLIKDLKKMEEDHGLIPQVMFFTGDAAFGNIGNVPESTLTEQFDGVHEVLEAVRTAFSTAVPKENIFIVPGNHDVDREEVTPDQTSWLAAQTQAKTVNDLIQKGDRQWQRFVDRLAAYRDFLVRHKYSHLLSDPKRLIYSETRDLHGLKLGIAGFNSAWACGGDGEKGKLWFGGDWQSGELLGKLSKADFLLALIHHPFGWFVEQEDTPLRILFEREFAFHLHGHEHLGWVDAKVDGHVRLAAAACYDSSHMDNGYNFVRLNLDTGEGEVWLRKYDAQGGGWVPRAVAGKTSNDGLWRLGKLPWLQPLLAKAKPVNPR